MRLLLYGCLGVLCMVCPPFALFVGIIIIPFRLGMWAASFG
jgi:hypothetical protein